MTLQSDLIAARALIDTPEKWAQGEFEDNGCYCALGAVSMAATGNSNFDRYYYVGNAADVASALRAQLPHNQQYVSDFNDDPRTTHADILALFDRAIKAAS